MLHLTSCLCGKQIMYFRRLQVTRSCFALGACSDVVVIIKYHFRITLKNWKYNCYFVLSEPKDQGPVVWRPIGANPKLNFNLGLFIPLFKSLFGIISGLLFRASNNYDLGKKNSTEFSFKLSDLKSDFTLTLGYLNPALNNPTHIVILQYFTHLTLGLKDKRVNDSKHSEHVLVHDILIKHISHFFSFFITLNLNQIVFFLYGHLQLSNNNL